MASLTRSRWAMSLLQDALRHDAKTCACGAFGVVVYARRPRLGRDVQVRPERVLGEVLDERGADAGAGAVGEADVLEIGVGALVGLVELLSLRQVPALVAGGAGVGDQLGREGIVVG